MKEIIITINISFNEDGTGRHTAKTAIDGAEKGSDLIVASFQLDFASSEIVNKIKNYCQITGKEMDDIVNDDAVDIILPENRN